MQYLLQHNQNAACLCIKLSTHIDFRKENNEKDPKFKIGDHVRISKYNFFLQKVSSKLI